MPPFIAPPDPFDDRLSLAPIRPPNFPELAFDDDDLDEFELRSLQLGGRVGAGRSQRPRLNLTRRDVSPLMAERETLQREPRSNRTERIITGLGLATSVVGALAGSPGLAGAGEIAATSAALPGQQRRERRGARLSTLDEQIAEVEQQNRRSQELEDRALHRQAEGDFVFGRQQRASAQVRQEQREAAVGVLQARQAEAERVNTRERQESLDTEGRRNQEFRDRRALTPTLQEQARINASNRSNRGRTSGDDPEKAREKARKQEQLVVRLESKLRLNRQRVTAIEEALEKIGQSPTLLSGDEAVKLRAQLDTLNENVFVLESELDSLEPTDGAPAAGERARRRLSGDPKFGGGAGGGGADEPLTPEELDELRRLEGG